MALEKYFRNRKKRKEMITRKEMTDLITAYGWSNKDEYCLTNYTYRKDGYTIIMPPDKDFFWYKSGSAKENYFYQIQCKIQYSDVTITERPLLHGEKDFKVIETKECKLYI